MIVNFVGNYQAGYVGEKADETHLADSIQSLGHVVRRIPRDVWKAYVDDPENPDERWVLPREADINIIAKWHHFNDGKYIEELAKKSNAPVFYWVWDYMWDQGFPEWHLNMARAADLYLSGEGGIHWSYLAKGVEPYYFQFDVCDGGLQTFQYEEADIENDVIFTGTYLGQGDRIDYLKKINARHKIKVYSYNHKEWEKNGFEAYPAVYGEAYNKLIAKSRIVLGFNVNPHCWGYWSNRIGKVAVAGGFLLQQYAPGMEQFLTTNVDYFNTPGQAVAKIDYYLDHPNERRKKVDMSMKYRHRFTSIYKAAQLMILVKNYINGFPGKWNLLP